MGNNNSNEVKLLYPEEHIKCLHYVSDKRCFFKHHILKQQEEFLLIDKHCNHLIFTIKGDIDAFDIATSVHTDLGEKRILFIPQNTPCMLCASSISEFLVCSFDVPVNICDKLIFSEISTNACYDPTGDISLPIKQPMYDFINLLLVYLKNSINCEHLHEIKQKEMFLIFKWFYTKSELAQLFHSLSRKNHEFRRSVIENYQKANDVGHLATLIGMSRTRFDVKFKEEFGTTPRQWMLKQLADKVRYASKEPGVTIDALIQRFNFNSTVSFIRFCKAQFGQTPSELIGKK